MARQNRLVMCIAVGGLAACAPSLFERHLAAHRWEAAADEFARDSSLHRNEEALFEAALLHATPGTAVHDPGRARSLLARLQQKNPRPRRHTAILRLSAMLDVLERAEEMEQRSRSIAGDLATLTEQVERFLEESDQSRLLVSRALATRDSLFREVARLKSAIREKQLELRNLQSELERLKAIDLRSPDVPAAAAPPQAGGATQPQSDWR